MARKKDNRFGTTAISMGFITKEQLIEALSIQAAENVEQNTHRLLGEILVSEGMMSSEQVEDVLETMSNRIAYAIGGGR